MCMWMQVWTDICLTWGLEEAQKASPCVGSVVMVDGVVGSVASSISLNLP